MRFLFYPFDCLPVYRNILDELPLGGTETGIICLANALAEFGHEVTVISSVNDESANPRFLLPNNPLLLQGTDIFISIRSWRPIFSLIERKKTFLWTGDDANVVHNFGIGDPRVLTHLDNLLCVSDWQANLLCHHSGFPKQKVWLLRNGVQLSYFSGSETRQKKRLIFTAHPSRGLDFVPYIFSSLKKNHKDIELHIFGGAATHGKNESEKEQRLFEDLKKMDGCFVHGPVKQRELSREMMRSAVWIYPTAFRETSCISAMEAQAAGCAIITSALAALPETVGQAGGLLTEIPGSQEYLNKFIEETDKILTDEKLLDSLSYKALEQAKNYDWKARAKSFLGFLKIVHCME